MSFLVPVWRHLTRSPVAHNVLLRASSTQAGAAEYRNLLVEKQEKGVLLIRLNRPKAYNALCDDLFHELNAVLRSAEKDPEVGAIVLTGSDKAFAAGADIKEMEKRTYPVALHTDMLGHWSAVATLRKPIIAAVNGFALGGGCELAMMCDIIVAGENAKFGQPEVNIGTIPGGGGSQRLIRAMGKSRAMEMILTGDPITAQEAANTGLVSRVVPVDQTVPNAIDVAQRIARHSQPVIQLAKECVQAAYEVPLSAGLAYERRLFHSTFALKDQKEGMGAFLGKRKPSWSNE